MKTCKQEADKETEEAFKVFVRIRPLIKQESFPKQPKNGKRIVSVVEDKEGTTRLWVSDPDWIYEYAGRREKNFDFDCVFQEFNNNKSVFSKTVLPVLSNVLEGFNATWFAYGMTGSGKTHTMLGDIYNSNEDENGIWIITIEKLFDLINKQNQIKYEVKISYLEIYNEQVRDLLIDKQTQLMIVEDPIKGVIVPDITEINVENSFDLANLIIEGNNRRTMASTFANQFSSRSHAILQISLQASEDSFEMENQIIYSKLSLIDLAGSERAASTLNRGQRMVEGANINKSLFALGNWINILSDK